VFGAERWSVGYYAEITRVGLVRRIELLPDEPDHPRAQDEYYRIEVGELRPLPRPIPSRRLRRIVFIPTSLERLMRATEVNDLFKTSPIEDVLYERLRDGGFEPERQYFVREDGAGSMLDLTLFCRDGSLNIECDGDAWHTGPKRSALDRERDNRLVSGGWHVLRFSGRDIQRRPDYCLETVSKAVQTLGGPARGRRGRRA
jgi:very-short-patch-repair endonuclease